MKASVLINNYNYGRFLLEAVRSVINQAHEAYEIIIVDDGSTDESSEVLGMLSSLSSKIHTISQANQGQLAAIRAGIRASTGDWCFFLDADDAWEPEHLANAAHAVMVNPDAAVWYAGHRESAGPPLFRSKWPAGATGPCAALVSATGVRIGTITSAVGLRRDIASEILALPRELDALWRIRADDVLLYAAAFAGAVIHYSPGPSLRYRIHGGNHFAKAGADSEAYIRAKEHLFDVCRQRYGIEVARHLELLHSELSVMVGERRGHEVLRRYRRAILRADAPLAKRAAAYFSTFCPAFR